MSLEPSERRRLEQPAAVLDGLAATLATLSFWLYLRDREVSGSSIGNHERA